MCKLTYIPSWISDAKTILEKLNRCIAYIEINKVVANPDKTPIDELEKIEIAGKTYLIKGTTTLRLFKHVLTVENETASATANKKINIVFYSSNGLQVDFNEFKNNFEKYRLATSFNPHTGKSGVLYEISYNSTTTQFIVKYMLAEGLLVTVDGGVNPNSAYARDYGLITITDDVTEV